MWQLWDLHGITGIQLTVTESTWQNCELWKIFALFPTIPYIDPVTKLAKNLEEINNSSDEKRKQEPQGA